MAPGHHYSASDVQDKSVVLNIDLKLQGPFIDLFPRVMLAPENFRTFFLLSQHIAVATDP